ncbi:MAG: sensor histidine kinase [Marmoricola sp.]
MTARTRRLTLRTRLLLVGLAGVAVATAVGGAALYAVLWYTGLHGLDRDATATADQVSALVRSHRLPDPIPVTGDQVVQVLDHRLRVVSASVNGDRLTALLRRGELRDAERSPVEVPGSRIGLVGGLRVVVHRVPGTTDAVLVAQQTDELHRSARVLRNALLISFPVLLVVLGLIAWRMIGATLQPVERLRAGAERISGSGHDERLPVTSSSDEVHDLAITLNSMLDRLADSRERQRVFVGDVAHELRSPLTSIRTQLEISQRLGEGGALVDDLHADVLRMSALVEDLLTLARLDADSAPLSPAAPVPVGDALARVGCRYRNARVAVGVRPCPSGLEVATDPDELDRVMGNLVDNAVRHAADRVDLSALPAGPRVVLRVEDDGPGIAEPDRGRVMQRFTRLDEARDRDAGGSGLGLAIVHELVGRRGGEVRLGASPSGGLRVDVELPRT